jgi:integrase
MAMFIKALKQQNYSPATQEKYGHHLRRLASFLAAYQVTRPAEITRELLLDWGASLPDTWAPNTMKQAIAAVKSYLKWCNSVKPPFITEILDDVLKTPKVGNREQRTLDLEEALRVIDACDGTRRGQRDRALISLMLDGGLRATEACRLRIDGLEFDVTRFDPLTGEKILVNRATVRRKGGKEQRALFGPLTAQRIRDWLAVRQARPGVEELFVSVGGTRPGTGLTRDGLRVIVRRLARQASVAHFSPHALRRTFACLLDEAGASSRKIQAYGGWANIKEVEIYTRNAELERQYNQYSPVSFLEKISKINNQDTVPVPRD